MCVDLLETVRKSSEVFASRHGRGVYTGFVLAASTRLPGHLQPVHQPDPHKHTGRIGQQITNSGSA